MTNGVPGTGIAQRATVAVPISPPDRAVVTLCLGEETRRLAEVTHPFMASYARRIGAEFVVLTEAPDLDIPHFNKFLLRECLRSYRRVVYLDTDLIVAPGCPDLFERVPEPALGVYFESADYDRSYSIDRIQAALGQIEWRGDYFNSGVMVLSPAHREIFGVPFGKFVDEWYQEQTLLNYNARRLQIPFFCLSQRFNFIPLKSDSPQLTLTAQRFGAYIIHYAGPPVMQRARIALISRDTPWVRRLGKVPGLRDLIYAAFRAIRSLDRLAGKIRRRHRARAGMRP
jgi:hypothetical protein